MKSLKKVLVKVSPLSLLLPVVVVALSSPVSVAESFESADVKTKSVSIVTKSGKVYGVIKPEDLEKYVAAH